MSVMKNTCYFVTHAWLVGYDVSFFWFLIKFWKSYMNSKFEPLSVPKVIPIKWPRSWICTGNVAKILPTGHLRPCVTFKFLVVYKNVKAVTRKSSRKGKVWYKHVWSWWRPQRRHGLYMFKMLLTELFMHFLVMYAPCICLCKLTAHACFRPPGAQICVSASTYLQALKRSMSRSRSRSRSRSLDIYFSNASWRNMNNQCAHIGWIPVL